MEGKIMVPENTFQRKRSTRKNRTVLTARKLLDAADAREKEQRQNGRKYLESPFQNFPATAFIADGFNPLSYAARLAEIRGLSYPLARHIFRDSSKMQNAQKLMDAVKILQTFYPDGQFILPRGVVAEFLEIDRMRTVRLIHKLQKHSVLIRTGEHKTVYGMTPIYKLRTKDITHAKTQIKK